MLTENKVKILFKKDKVSIKGKKYEISGTSKKIKAPNFRGPFKGFKASFNAMSNIFTWSNKLGENFLIKLSDFDIEVAR